MGKKLYVGNLAFDVTSKELEDLFAQAGICESVAIISDRATGQSRGFGFVEMGSDAEAQQAITELNEYQLGGRGLTVNEARPKAAFGGGGQSNGGGNRRRSEPRW